MRNVIAKSLLCTSLTLAASAAGVSAGRAAEGSPPFYSGKSVSFIVSSVAGSGYDLYARAVARHYPQHLAGTPGFVVQNMPGASGIRAMNFLYNVAGKDGLSIGLLPNFSSLAPFYKVKQAKFDSTKFNWLGSPSQELSVFLLWHTVPINSVAEAKNRQIILGSAGAAGTGAFYARVLGKVFGLNFKLIQGYSGLGGAMMAMERGEIEGYPSVFWNTLKSTRGDWIKQGKIKFLVQWSRSGEPELKNVPYAGDLATNDADRKMIEIAAVPLKLGRPIAAPPDIPAARVAELKSGLESTFKDPAYLKDCEQQRLDCTAPVTGAELSAVIRNVYAAPDAVRQRLIGIYQEGRKDRKKKKKK